VQSTFHAPDIECDGCANSIKRALGRLAGIETVEVDVEAKNVTVGYDSPANEATVRSALDSAGFPTK
jgi:copper chaperone